MRTNRSHCRCPPSALSPVRRHGPAVRVTVHVLSAEYSSAAAPGVSFPPLLLTLVGEFMPIRDLALANTAVYGSYTRYVYFSIPSGGIRRALLRAVLLIFFADILNGKGRLCK